MQTSWPALNLLFLPTLNLFDKLLFCPSLRASPFHIPHFLLCTPRFYILRVEKFPIFSLFWLPGVKVSAPGKPGAPIFSLMVWICLWFWSLDFSRLVGRQALAICIESDGNMERLTALFSCKWPHHPLKLIAMPTSTASSDGTLGCHFLEMNIWWHFRQTQSHCGTLIVFYARTLGLLDSE